MYVCIYINIVVPKASPHFVCIIMFVCSSTYEEHKTLLDIKVWVGYFEIAKHTEKLFLMHRKRKLSLK